MDKNYYLKDNLKKKINPIITISTSLYYDYNYLYLMTISFHNNSFTFYSLYILYFYFYFLYIYICLLCARNFINLFSVFHSFKKISPLELTNDCREKLELVDSEKCITRNSELDVVLIWNSMYQVQGMIHTRSPRFYAGKTFYLFYSITYLSLLGCWKLIRL